MKKANTKNERAKIFKIISEIGRNTNLVIEINYLPISTYINIYKKLEQIPSVRIKIAPKKYIVGTEKSPGHMRIKHFLDIDKAIKYINNFIETYIESN